MLFNLQFSNEEKKNCLPIAHRLVRFADSAQKNGIIYLEDEILESEENTYLKMGIWLLSSGVSAEIMEKSFLYSFVTNKSTGEELLKRLLISSSLQAMYNQGGACVVAHILGVLLGAEYLPELLETVSITINLEEIIDTHTRYIPESLEFEQKLLSLPNWELFHVLTPVSYFTLAIAFQGCSKSFINSMKVGISQNRFIQMCEAFSSFHHDKETILEHQNLILHTLG